MTTEQPTPAPDAVTLPAGIVTTLHDALASAYACGRADAREPQHGITYRIDGDKDQAVRSEIAVALQIAVEQVQYLTNAMHRERATREAAEARARELEAALNDALAEMEERAIAAEMRAKEANSGRILHAVTKAYLTARSKGEPTVLLVDRLAHEVWRHELVIKNVRKAEEVDDD